MRDGDHRGVREEIAAVVDEAPGRIVKVILETALLSPEEIDSACGLAREGGAVFVKTSTGFGPGGATVESVARMRAAVGDALGVKASGGIRDAGSAMKMLSAGADRLGTSASLAIMAGWKEHV
jgi:deoxyribose-phosphate aldolase